MDHREPLKLHTVLTFDGAQYHVEDVVGCGSNAIVYRGWYADRLNPAERHYVLIKELFPFHPQGRIWRGEENRIVVDAQAEDFFQMHRQSFEAGNEAHLRLLAQHPEQMGANLNSYLLNGTLYSILGYSGGRSLQAELAAPGQTLRRHTQRMLLLLQALEAFHEGGYLHLDVSPDNIMLVGRQDSERIFLIDYNSARQVGVAGGVYTSFKAGYSAPEVETNLTASIGYASDLYSVAAVFYCCLMGRPLTLEQMLRPKAPDAAESEYLRAAPQTVVSMVRQILRRGLNALPSKRYQSAAQMREAFAELLDRIDCIGVTHWALWESGRRGVDELIRVNPALRYILDVEHLYPIRLACPESMTLQQYLAQLISPEGSSGLLLAQGGMGKTTMLLHAALLQSRRYSPASPAVIYLSLSGCRQVGPRYILERILARLRFGREMNTYDGAMHALEQLLRRPLKTKDGERPAVLLLLDGLNEIRGELEPLAQQIGELSGWAGVRILAASRGEIPSVRLAPARLIQLEDADIQAALGDKGLLMPKDAAVVRLLRTPLILSIYIEASRTGAQLQTGSEEELLQAYLQALLQKELRQLPENAPERWQLDAALRYVLPCIAYEQQRQGCALTDAQLLKLVGNCRRALRSRIVRREFPEWIGRSKEIAGGAQDAEQWYGLMAHQLLWQRLGLLLRESDGGYRIFHQKMEEHLARSGRRLARRIGRGRAARVAAAASVFVCAALAVTIALTPRSYDAQKTRQVIDRVAVCYSAYGMCLSDVQELTQLLCDGNTSDFLLRYARVAQEVAREAVLTDDEQYDLELIDALCASGERVAWSKLAFAGDEAQTLINDSSGRLEEYAEYLPLLRIWAQSQRAQADYPAFPQTFAKLLEADAQVMSKLYYLSCAPHLAGGGDTWREAVEKLTASVPGSGAQPEENLEKLRDTRRQTLETLAAMKSGVRLTGAEEGLLEKGE